MQKASKSLYSRCQNRSNLSHCRTYFVRGGRERGIHADIDVFVLTEGVHLIKTGAHLSSPEPERFGTGFQPT